MPALGACHARWEGFDLHAAVRVPAGQRDRLERVCRCVLYHGLLAPLLAWRAEVVPCTTPPATVDAHVGASGSELTPRPSARGASWADLMRRAFAVDGLACPRCGGRQRLIALIEASDVARRILTHLALPADVPRAAPARAPPSGDDDV